VDRQLVVKKVILRHQKRNFWNWSFSLFSPPQILFALFYSLFTRLNWIP